MLRTASFSLLIAVSVIASAGTGFRVAEASDEPTLETQCQQAAASRYEVDNKAGGVSWDGISGPHAEDVCRRAFDNSQDRSLLKLRWARALIANGKFGQGMEILGEAATKGDSVAMALLAEIARYGIKGSVDKEAAAVWLARAAQRGNGVAKSDLGEMFFSGEGLEKNYTTAAELLNSAGESRTSSGSALLGYLYFNGQGVRRDDVRAVNLFKAAAPENCLARFGLAVAKDQNRGGLDHGDLRKPAVSTGLESAYLWVVTDPKCPDQLRKAARTRANEISYDLDQYLIRRRALSGGAATFGEGVSQAMAAGAELMAVVREGKKAGLITPEMEKDFERIDDNFLKDEKLKQEHNCNNMGLRGRASGGGCTR